MKTNEPSQTRDIWSSEPSQGIVFEAPGGKLVNYNPPVRPKDPTSKLIPGHSDRSVNDPEYQMEVLRSSKLVSNTGKAQENPFQLGNAPLPVAPAPRAIPSVEAVAEQIQTVAQSVADAVENYHATKDDDSDRLRLIELGEEIAPLAKRVAELQSQIYAIRSKPSPAEKLIKDIFDLEASTDNAISNAMQSLLENLSQHIFGAHYKSLSESSRNDLKLGLGELRNLISRHQNRFRQRGDIKNVTAAIQAQEAILADLVLLLEILKTKKK